MIPIPHSKPKASLSTVMLAASKQWNEDYPGDELPEFFVLAVRGYYDQSIAPPGNNINAYDDAFFIVSPLGFHAFNANVDPTRYGWNPNAGKPMARLRTGCWRFIHRLHRGTYWAFGQGSNEVVVDRVKVDGKVSHTDTGCFGINIHRGGINSTSSEGCLTLVPDQWPIFYKRLHDTMRSLGVQVFDLILIGGPIN